MELILDGCKLMIFGVGWVFLFLIVMIVAVNFMASLLKPFAARFEPVPESPKGVRANSSDDDVKLAAVAAAAVARELGK